MSETGAWTDTVGQRESVGERTVRLALDWPIHSMSSDGVRSEDVMGVVDSRPPPGPHITLTTLYTSLNSHQNSSRIFSRLLVTLSFSLLPFVKRLRFESVRYVSGNQQ